MSAPEVTFFSATLNALVRCVYEVDPEQLDYQFGALNGGIEVTEIWHGDADLGQHLEANSAKCIENECRVALACKHAAETSIKSEHKAMFRRAMQERHNATKPVYLEPPRIELTAEQCKAVDDTAGIAA